jgi:Tfp pilus assembly protein PilO
MTLRGWRQELRLWLPALVLLVVNLGAFGVYRVFLAGDARARERRVAQARTDYSRLVARRERAESLAAQAGRNERRLERLYKSRFQTEEQRITQVIAEVKDLARRAGLDPPRISYPDQPIENFGLIKRSIVFGVDGTYLALRRFINFLELSESFVTLEEIRPSDSFDGRASKLSISLRVSTLFLADDVDPAALARSKDALGVSR